MLAFARIRTNVTVTHTHSKKNAFVCCANNPAGCSWQSASPAQPPVSFLWHHSSVCECECVSDVVAVALYANCPADDGQTTDICVHVSVCAVCQLGVHACA